MATESPLGKIEVVRTLERELKVARRTASRALKLYRGAIPLRQLAPKVRRSAAALSLLENGQTWETTTAEKYARAIAAMRAA